MELFRNIFFNTDKVVENTDVRVTYAGKLFQNGSKDVIVHYGFGEQWEYSQDVPMTKSELGYQADIHVQPNTKLNFCFRNSDGEWDNNNGVNYAFKIEKETETTGSVTPTWNTNTYTTGTTNPYTTGTTTGTYTTGTTNTTTGTYTTGTTNTTTGTYTTGTTNTTTGTYTTGTTSKTTGTYITGTTNTTTGTSTTGKTNTTTGTSKTKTTNTNNTVNNGTYQNCKSLTTTNSTWGDLFKKTFNNFINCFSKLFSTNKGTVNNENK